MRRKRNAYKKATRESELWLRALTDETGGQLFVPRSTKEMPSQADEIASEIDGQYVVTYTPKRPLVDATPGEYRRTKVTSRLAGMEVRARHGYVARPQ